MKKIIFLTMSLITLLSTSSLWACGCSQDSAQNKKYSTQSLITTTTVNTDDKQLPAADNQPVKTESK